MESLLYSVNGLPVHALVVHFAVVLLPLAAVALLVAVYKPRFRSQYALAALVITFLGVGAAFVAKQSGEALAEKIGLPKTHANYGDVLPLIAGGFFLLALFWYRTSKRKTKVDLLGHSTALAALVVVAFTFLTGHSGAEAVWKAPLEATNAATPTPTTTVKPSASVKAFSKAEVAKHATPSDCWAIINGNVYNLTKWINQHPGGPGVIKALCGQDGSAQFNGQHGGQKRPASELAGFKIGSLK